MALEEGDITRITEIINQALDARNGDNGGNNDGNNGNGDNGNKANGKGDADDVKRIKDEEAKKKSEEDALRNAIRFNVGLDGFLESNKKFIPESVNSVFNAYKGNTYASDKEEADTKRKVILDEIFAKQENIDILPESLKSKILEYKGLAESDKRNNSSQYFDVVETYLALRKGQAQKEFNNNNGSEQSDYSKRFEALGERFKTNK